MRLAGAPERPLLEQTGAPAGRLSRTVLPAAVSVIVIVRHRLRHRRGCEDAAGQCGEARRWHIPAHPPAKEADAAAAAAERERKAKEKADLLAKEEAELASMRKLRGADKVAARKAMKADDDHKVVATTAAPVLAARSIDAAIAMLDVATGSAPAAVAATAGASSHHEKESARIDAVTHSLATGLKIDDRHPERRMKAAFAKFQEEYMPILREEHPSLKRSQLQEMLWQTWQKSSANPMNAAHLTYDTKRGGSGAE